MSALVPILAQDIPSIKELRARCQSTAPAPERETFTGKRARFFSIYLTRLFLKTTVSPNQITTISVFVFFCGVCSFLFPWRWAGVVGALLVFFATVLDGCDGEVSRFRALNNPAGALYVEPVSHDIQYGLMFLPLGIAATIQTNSWIPLAFAFCAGASKSITRLLENRYWFMTRPTITEGEIKELRKEFLQRPPLRRLISWAKRNIFTSNGLILPLLVAGIFMKIDWYVYFYGAMFPVLWLLVFAKQLHALPHAVIAMQKTQSGAAD